MAAESASASPYNYVRPSLDKRPSTSSHVQPLFQHAVGRQYLTLTLLRFCSCRKHMCVGGVGWEESGSLVGAVLGEAVTEGAFVRAETRVAVPQSLQ